MVVMGLVILEPLAIESSRAPVFQSGVELFNEVYLLKK